MSAFRWTSRRCPWCWIGSHWTLHLSSSSLFFNLFFYFTPAAHRWSTRMMAPHGLDPTSDTFFAWNPGWRTCGIKGWVMKMFPFVRFGHRFCLHWPPRRRFRAVIHSSTEEFLQLREKKLPILIYSRLDSRTFAFFFKQSEKSKLILRGMARLLLWVNSVVLLLFGSDVFLVGASKYRAICAALIIHILLHFVHCDHNMLLIVTSVQPEAECSFLRIIH